MALATNALTLLATAKSDLGISGSSEDTKVERLINAASAALEAYCSRVFWRSTAVVEKVAGFGGLYLRVSRTPVNSLTAIAFDGSALDITQVTIDDSKVGLLARPGGWEWTAHTAPDTSGGGLPGTERLLYQVTYDGGWYTPKQESEAPNPTRTLPYDVEEACLEFVRELYHLKRRDPTVESERLLSWAATYRTGEDASGIPAGVRTLIDPYRRLT